MSRSRPRVLSRCSFQTGSASVVREQRGAVVGAAAAALRAGARRPRAMRPVGARLAGRRHRGAHAADAAFAVGHRAVLLAPGAGRQQQIGEGGGGGGGVGLLQRRRIRSAAARGAPWPGRAVDCAGLVQAIHSALICAVGRGLEHLDRALARRGGHVGDAPQRGDFGAVLRVGQVAVRAAAGWPARRPRARPSHSAGRSARAARRRACRSGRWPGAG